MIPAVSRTYHTYWVTYLQKLIYAWLWKNGARNCRFFFYLHPSKTHGYNLLSSKSFWLQVTQRRCTITSQLLRTCMVQTLLFGPIHQSLLHPCVLGTQCTLVMGQGHHICGNSSLCGGHIKDVQVFKYSWSWSRSFGKPTQTASNALSDGACQPLSPKPRELPKRP